MDNMITYMFRLQQSDQEAMCSKPTDKPVPGCLDHGSQCTSALLIAPSPGLIWPLEWPAWPSVGTLGRSPLTTKWHVWSACSPDQLRETCSRTCSVGFRSVTVHVEQEETHRPDLDLLHGSRGSGCTHARDAVKIFDRPGVVGHVSMSCAVAVQKLYKR